MIYQIAQTRGAALAPLSNEQKQKLAAMARYAWIEVGPDQSFDDWRHDEVMACVRRAGLRECVNEDYNQLKARWLYTSGKVEASYRAAMKHATEPREWAMFELLKACREAADVLPEAMKYARGFVKNKRGMSLEGADDRTIWHAIFTVRNKASALRGTRKPRGRRAQAGTSSLDLAGRTEAAPRVRHVKGPF
jgi:hypothetical protein